MTPSPFERRIFDLRRPGIKYDLTAMRDLCRRLDHPERAYATVHVAGTNGKGSTAAMLASMLGAAGYRVGLNTSPHLVSFRERIRIDGCAAADDDLLRSFERVEPAVHASRATFFEATTALAFQHFADAAVDVAVIEVGLGGRLDATNVIDSSGAVVTQLGFDHTRILGSTIEAIAAEKAGIFRRGTPAVVGDDPLEALPTLRAEAARVGASIDVVRRGVDWADTSRGLHWKRGDVLYPVGLAGEHQRANAALAVGLVERLNAGGTFRVPAEAVRRGLSEVRWPGRLDRRRVDGGTVLFDVAHNEGGARALVSALLHAFGSDRPAVVLGMLADKRQGPVIEALAPVAERLWVTTPPGTERRLPAAELGAMCRARGFDCDVEPDPGRAVRAALALGRPVVVTGSLFTVGAAMNDLGLAPADERVGAAARPFEPERVHS